MGASPSPWPDCNDHGVSSSRLQAEDSFSLSFGMLESLCSTTQGCTVILSASLTGVRSIYRTSEELEALKSVFQESRTPACAPSHTLPSSPSKGRVEGSARKVGWPSEVMSKRIFPLAQFPSPDFRSTGLISPSPREEEEKKHNVCIYPCGLKVTILHSLLYLE